MKILSVSAASTAGPEAELYLTAPNCLTNAPRTWSGTAYVYRSRLTGV